MFKNYVRMLSVVALAMFSAVLTGFERPEYIDEAVWNLATPHLIPEDHPIKAKLDSIFTKTRASSSEKSLRESGFRIRKGRKWDNVLVLQHKKLKGYVVKLYTDDQMGVNEWDALIRRATGAKLTQECIDRHDYNHLLVAPKKWIYPLPETPLANPQFQQKNFILIAEDMHILKGAANGQRWFGPTMDDDMLRAVFTVITEVGLVDTVFPDNMPFCADGRIAFVDTEHYNKWPIPYHRLMHFLSFDNQNYWMALVADKGR